VWNKRSEEDPARPAPPLPPLPQPRPLTPASLAGPPDARPQTAVIGPSMHIKGEIRSDEELLVEGEVEGTVESRSLLTVGANGRVNANIKARDVVILGSVKGNIDASEKLAIRDEGSLIGDVRTAGISIDERSYFKGSIDIVRPEPKGTAKAG
jgi:cytoskeletal protein CcmA (bactofilin family)